jgi:hypothetical protein
MAISSRVASSRARLEKCLSKADAALASGNVYEALQVIKALASRYAGREKDPRAACDLLVRGVERVMAFEQTPIASDLAEELVATLERGGLPVGDESVGWCERAAEQLPARSAARLALLTSALRWSSAPPGPAEAPGTTSPEARALARRAAKGSPRLHRLIANEYLPRAWRDPAGSQSAAGASAERLALATKHLLWAQEPEALADACARWAVLGMRGEEDLFLARATLQLLACVGPSSPRGAPGGGVDQASRLLRAARRAGRSGAAGAAGPTESPLGRFCALLIEAAALEGDASKQALGLLRRTYATALRRDPRLEGLVASVAEQYFGAPPAPRAPTFDDVLENVMRGVGPMLQQMQRNGGMQKMMRAMMGGPPPPGAP